MNSEKIVNKKVLFVATNTEFIKENCMLTLKWLKENEYEVHVVSNGNEEIEYCDKYFNVPFVKSKIKTYKILKKIIEENNYDFIHCYTLLGGILTRIAARKSKSKIIYTAQVFPFYKGCQIKNWLIYYPIEKYLSKYTDILVTTNEEDYILAKNKFKSPKVKLINGLGINKEEMDIHVNEYERKEFLQEFNLNKEDFIFLSIGKLNKSNNQILQIEAVMQIIPEYKNIKLLIVGDGPLDEYYSNIILKYELSEYIKLIGERKDILRLLKLSDCMLATSKIDRRRDNVIKAMFVNKPIVASRIREYQNLLKDENLVSLNSSDELIRKLEEHIITGKRKVFYGIEKYDLEKVTETMKNIYKSL